MSPLSNRPLPPVSTVRPTIRREPPRSEDDLRAIKRALIHAPLGPTAAQALASAAIELEERLSRRRWERPMDVQEAPLGHEADSTRPSSAGAAGPAGRD